MNYSSQSHHSDSSSQAQQFSNDYYYWYYSQIQNTNAHPSFDHNLPTQQQEEYVPNPPGVTATQDLQQVQNSFYQYTDRAAASLSTPMVQQQSIEQQPSYENVGPINGVVPQGIPQPYLGPKQNLSGHQHLGWGPSMGHALDNHGPLPSQDQAVYIQSGSHVEGRRYQSRHSYSSVSAPVSSFQDQARSLPFIPPRKPAWCDLCRVNCNTLEVLQNHMNGKKHTKKVKIFEEFSKLNGRGMGSQMELISTSQPNIAVSHQPHQNSGPWSQQSKPETLPSQAISEDSTVALGKRKAEEVLEPSEQPGINMRNSYSKGVGRGTKRKMRGSKGMRKMRPGSRAKKVLDPTKPKDTMSLACELCGVKCESAISFQSHLAGRKHQSRAKGILAEPKASDKEVLHAAQSALTSLHQQNVNASTSRDYLAVVTAISEATEAPGPVLVEGKIKEGCIESDGVVAIATATSGTTPNEASAAEQVRAAPSSTMHALPGQA